MKPAKSKDGYWKTMLLNDAGKYKTITVHRMVATTFIPNVNNLPQLNHKNGNKDDNSVDNLEWCTHTDNVKHCHENNLQRYFKGEEVGNSILKEHQVLEIRKKFRKRIYTREMLAKEYGVKACTIKDIILRRSWKHI